MASTSAIITFVIYLIAVFGIGIFGYFLTKTFEDFALGGRKMKDWIVGLSAQASDMSMWLLVGLPATAYLMGLSALWIGVGIIVGTGFNWFVLSKRLRRYSGMLESMTVLDFLEQRVRDNLGIIKIIGSISMVIFFAIATSGEFIGSGKVLDATFDIPFTTGVIIGGIVVLMYTVLGGFIAVSFTDALQAMVMGLTVVLLPIVGFLGISSLGTAFTDLHAASGAPLGVFGDSVGAKALLALMGGTVGIGLGYPGQPHINVRYMSIDKPENLRRSTLIGMIWVTLATYGAIFLGWAAGSHLGAIEVTDQVMPLLAEELLPSWVVGIMVAGAMAGMMSTSDSKFLVATNCISYNIYKRFIHPDASDREILWISRGLVVFMVAIAMAMAQPEGVVFSVILGGWAGIGSSFGPLMIAALYWKRLTKWGAYAGVITGMATVGLWIFYDIGYIYELVPGFVFAGLAIIIVSLLTKAPGKEVIEEFETATKARGLKVKE